MKLRKHATVLDSVKNLKTCDEMHALKLEAKSVKVALCKSCNFFVRSCVSAVRACVCLCVDNIDEIKSSDEFGR
jgi:hypothetical protein